jgi:hypothetical protein
MRKRLSLRDARRNAPRGSRKKRHEEKTPVSGKGKELSQSPHSASLIAHTRTRRDYYLYPVYSYTLQRLTISLFIVSAATTNPSSGKTRLPRSQLGVAFLKTQTTTKTIPRANRVRWLWKPTTTTISVSKPVPLSKPEVSTLTNSTLTTFWNAKRRAMPAAPAWKRKPPAARVPSAEKKASTRP